jgi:hypothetical protein
VNTVPNNDYAVSLEYFGKLFGGGGGGGAGYSNASNDYEITTDYSGGWGGNGGDDDDGDDVDGDGDKGDDNLFEKYGSGIIGLTTFLNTFLTTSKQGLKLYCFTSI